MYHPAIGYSQGMSDLVAPLLAEVLDESDTFWCFVGLMQNTIFVSSPRDEDMERQLVRSAGCVGRAAGAEGRGDLARGPLGRAQAAPGPVAGSPAWERSGRPAPG